MMKKFYITPEFRMTLVSDADVLTLSTPEDGLGDGMSLGWGEGEEVS